MPVLRKIDCVRIRVADPAAAAEYYARTFGMSERWRQDGQVGLGMPETDAEIVFFAEGGGAPFPEVHYLVDDVHLAVAEAELAGCSVISAPFEIAIGWCAVIRDPFGTTLALLDMTRGPLDLAEQGIAETAPVNNQAVTMRPTGSGELP